MNKQDKGYLLLIISLILIVIVPSTNIGLIQEYTFFSAIFFMTFGGVYLYGDVEKDFYLVAGIIMFCLICMNLIGFVSL